MFLRFACLLFSLSLAAPALAVEQFGYRVVDKKPQDVSLYLQGLEIHDGKLYIGTGLNGESSLRRYDFATMQLETGRRLNSKLFGEGVTVLGDKIYQLTYHAQMMLVFRRDDLEFQKWSRIPGQGWGMTNDGEQIIYSDGSDHLYFVSPETLGITRALRVTENGAPVSRLNELEWIDGEIWANVFQTDRLVIINPETGAVRASVDLHGLLPVVERRPGSDTVNDVLNGIARDPGDGAIWVTGKRWPWLYRIELVPAATAGAQNAAESR